MTNSDTSLQRPRTRGRPLIVVTVVAAMCVFFGPASWARAAGGGVIGSPLVYNAEPNENNAVTVSREGPNLRIVDRGSSASTTSGKVEITAAPGCTTAATDNPDDTLVCPAAGITDLTLATYDGNDSVLL